MSFEEDFSAWLANSQKDLRTVFEMSQDELSDEPAALIVDLETIEAWNSRCLYLLAQANSFVSQALAFYLPDRTDDRRELDRKVLLDSRVAPIKEIRDKIEGLCDSIKQRLILGESILAFNRQFSEPKIKTPHA